MLVFYSVVNKLTSLKFLNQPIQCLTSIVCKIIKHVFSKENIKYSGFFFFLMVNELNCPYFLVRDYLFVAILSHLEGSALWYRNCL